MGKLQLPNTIKMVVTDFDGVLTDNCVYINEDFTMSRKLNFKDIMGVHLLRKNDFQIAIISGEKNSAIETLAKKYGVDLTDIEALNHAIDEDNTFFEDEALEKGISVEQLKEIRKIERENADLKKQMREQSVRENADRIYAGWLEQSDALKQIYPNFDLDAEIKNPRFVDLLKNNVDVRTAYEVLHKDDIIRGAMQFTADTVQTKLANNIIAGRNRPSENGIGQTSPAVVKNDVSQLSRADREEIIRRVARGEKIRF